jgi:hypothetical protein
LANALGKRGAVLLGDYLHFGRYMPFTRHCAGNENLRMLRREGAVADIPVQEVYSAIKEMILCARCQCLGK